jgi:hypothetical protein
MWHSPATNEGGGGGEGGGGDEKAAKKSTRSYIAHAHVHTTLINASRLENVVRVLQRCHNDDSTCQTKSAQLLGAAVAANLQPLAHTRPPPAG